MTTLTSPSTGAHDIDASERAGPVTGERSYRYPGSPPFRDVDLDRRLFKGRETEAKKVFHSILSADVFLLYAVSGMGKSSLLNAGVMHRLRARGYWPVCVRLNDTTASPVESIDRQIAEADIRDTSVEVQRTPGLDFAITAETTLWDLLGSLEVWRDDRLQQLVLVLDQFEEVFTLDWNADVRDRFIAEFGQVVRGHRSADGDELADTSAVPVPNVKFCIVIREDALGELEALADDVPQIMQNRFRLGALDSAQAEQAIRGPAMVDDGLLDTPPFAYSEEAAHHILDFLQETERAATLRISEANMDNSVDPSQLQIVCQYIERRVLPTKPTPPDGEVVTIEADDLGGNEGLRSVVGDFYRRTVGTFPATVQRSVQRLCEDGLISKGGRRLSIERGEIAAHYDVSPAVLDELVDQRLLRVEPRVGSAYYELSHDTLVKPILDDGAERRKAKLRRRRQFAFIAGGVAALLLLGFLTYRFGFDKGSDSVASMEFETPLRREVVSPGDEEVFRVVAREEPSLVVVDPSGKGALDATVTLTNSSKARREANQLGRLETERIVVPAGAGDRLTVAVRSDNTSTGEFEITHGALAVTALLAGESGQETVSGSIDESGSLAVYSVDVAEPSADGSDSAIEIVVNGPAEDEPALIAPDPSTKSRTPDEKPDPGLDVELEVIDPSGAGTIIDSNGAGDGERTTLSGAVGQYLVVVRGDATSTGEFDLTASAVTYTPLAIDGQAEGEVESPNVPVVFAIDAPTDGLIEVTVTPSDDLDVQLEIVDPRGGGILTVDSSATGEPEVGQFTGAGRHLVRVVGYSGSVGSFQIVSTTIDETELVDGEPATATVPAVFSAQAGGPKVVVVRSTSDLDSVLEIVSPSGVSSVVDWSGAGGAEFGELTEDGQHLVRVSGFNGSVGTFEILVEPVQTANLADGDSVRATAPAVFDVDVNSGEVLRFIAESADAANVLSLQVNDPGGYSSGVDGGPFAPGEPATATLDGTYPGTYKILVASSDPQAPITATIHSLHTTELHENEPVTVPGPAMFLVDLGEGQAPVFTAQPESADSTLDVSVTSIDGYSLGSSTSSPSAGEPATINVGGGAPGSYRIVVTSSGTDTDITATLQPGEPQRLSLGSGPVARYVAPATFEIDLGADERRLVIVTPQGGDEVSLEVTRSDGLAPPLPSYVYSPGSGEALLALLSGEGRHHVAVTTFGGGDGSFSIESKQLGEGG